MGELEAIDWYHGDISRHVAESLLLQSGRDGSYLLRDSNVNKGCYTLSVRCQNAVKHFPVMRNEVAFKFGFCTFYTLEEFTEHFKQNPVIGGDSEALTTLRYPYPRNVSEPAQYDIVGVHSIQQSSAHNPISPEDKEPQQDLALGTKEGFLTKLGKIHKVWKSRWFVLYRNELKYYTTRLDAKPIRTLDMTTAIEACRDGLQGKSHGFRIVFPSRTFYICASSEQEANDWVAILQWKIDNAKKICS